MNSTKKTKIISVLSRASGKMKGWGDALYYTGHIDLDLLRKEMKIASDEIDKEIDDIIHDREA